jgi:uroporphyrinogen decarboxylase
MSNKKTSTKMTPMQRALTTLGYIEPDRVPFFLLLTTHGAKELGMSIKDYFSKPEYVVEGQLRLQEKYRHDCLLAFLYAAVETESWGSNVIFYDNGPPNAGMPIIKKHEDISYLEAPVISESPGLQKVLEVTRRLKEKAGDDIPILGVAMSPFSLPVMQMGFDKYIELVYERPELLEQLMNVNEEFCVNWANAQLKAGATFICYFDPVSSTTIIPGELYRETGFKIARRTLARIDGPTATHFASGRCLPIVEDVIQTGTAAIGVSVLEDIAELKNACRKKMSIVGNLNGVEMHRWSKERAETAVKNTIARAGNGGGFILSDNHGEIPFQVPDEVLTAISDAVHKWGQYPLAPEMDFYRQN